MNAIATGRFRNLDNEQYWIERSIHLSEQQFNKLPKVEKEIKRHYRQAMTDIQTDLHAFYSRYADENGLSYHQAIQSLNSYEIGDYTARMAALKRQVDAVNPLAVGEIERLIKQGQYQRLASLLAQVDARLILLSQSEQMELFTPFLAEVYESSYYQSAYALSVGTGVATMTGIGSAFTRLSHKVVDEAIHYPWVGDMFSQRIWRNRNKLVNDMRDTIVNGLIRGSSVQKMSRELAGKMDSSYKNSLRLLRTETGHVHEEATAKSYDDFGIEQYKFLATLDKRTSKTCQNLDGQIFYVKDRQPGVNAAPMHPNCRSTSIPWFEGMNLIGRRANVGGMSIIVDGNLTYAEWEKKYLN